ncbi:MAG: hypothetical protein AABX26_02305 [Nanoarchaeota archaeon]
MQSQIDSRLRRVNVVSNGFSSCVSDAAKEFSGTPEMSFSEIISQLGMFLQQTESTVTFEKLKSFADAHRGRKFNEEMDVVNSDVKFIDFTPFTISNFSDKELTVHSNSIEFHRVHSIFAFPHEVESILAEAMLSRFQVHFSSPIAHAKFSLVSRGLGTNPSLSRNSRQLNFEGSDSSQNLKVWVSSLQM